MDNSRILGQDLQSWQDTFLIGTLEDGSWIHGLDNQALSERADGRQGDALMEPTEHKKKNQKNRC